MAIFNSKLLVIDGKLVLPGIGAIARRAAADGARGGAHGGANGQAGTAWPMGFKQGKRLPT